MDVVRELYGVMAAKGAAGGFVVTSGRFTEDATRFASGRNLKLIDGPLLHTLIRGAQQAHDANAPRVNAEPSLPAAEDATISPKCPTCAQPMLMRTAKRGANAGSAFWGCTAYPASRGTRPLD